MTGGPAIAKSANIFQSDGKYIVAQMVFVGAPRGRDEDTQVVRFTAMGNVDSKFSSPISDFVGGSSRKCARPLRAQNPTHLAISN